ncbi:MAG: acyl-CoA dehydrogenase family protein [Dehalococcoidia bacterium]
MARRQEHSIAKVFLANVVHKRVDTAVQLHGAGGYSHDTPLEGWYTAIRSQRPLGCRDEVQRRIVEGNVIKAWRGGTSAMTAGGELL